MKCKVDVLETYLNLLDTCRQYIHVSDLLITLQLIQLPTSTFFFFFQVSTDVTGTK